MIMGMKGKPKDVRLNLCSVDCSGAAAIDDWNRECFCFTVDPRTLHEQLDARLDAHGLPQDFAKSHPHLFSALPLYVSRRHIEQTAPRHRAENSLDGGVDGRMGHGERDFHL